MGILISDTARTGAAMGRNDNWYPGATPTERARRIANTLLAFLEPTLRQSMTARAHAIGETWLGEDLNRYGPDDVVPPATAARIGDTTTATLRYWVSEQVLERVGTGYRVGAVLDAARVMRERRAGSRAPRRARHPAVEAA